MAKNNDFYRRGVSMSDKRVETPSARRILWVIFFSVLGTVIMVYLDAYENLHRFISAYSISGFKEFIVFFPVFIAMGFVLFSAKQIKDLESEIKKRRKTEEALIDSEKKFRELSITDELTGLFNVRYFFNQLKAEIERTDRYSKPLSLIFVDIDAFKNYNDKFGHLEGDQVLRKIAQAIQSCMRGPDSAYRYGGDEFVGILPETREPGAAIVAERIRKIVNTYEFLPNPDKAVYMTVSVGFAEYTPGEGEKAFVKRADMNMYVAKNKV
jgi:diguanylate cyclase (GGDEF)-like protein